MTIPTYNLNKYNWIIIEHDVRTLFQGSKIQHMQLKEWLKPIMDEYCSNWIIEFDHNYMRIKIEDKCFVFQEFIPNVPSAEYHLLSKTSQKRLFLGYIEYFHPSTNPSLTTQFAFKLHHNELMPFMVVFEQISNHLTEFVKTITINGVVIQLFRDPQISNNMYALYYMGNSSSSYYYSYLPTFKKLFFTDDQWCNKIEIETKFDLFKIFIKHNVKN